jgi:hypothetical protein
MVFPILLRMLVCPKYPELIVSGRRACLDHFERLEIPSLAESVLVTHHPDMNTVSSALLLANYALDERRLGVALRHGLPLFQGVLRASLDDNTFQGRVWSPKGVCQVRHVLPCLCKPPIALLRV